MTTASVGFFRAGHATAGFRPRDRKPRTRGACGFLRDIPRAHAGRGSCGSATSLEILPSLLPFDDFLDFIGLPEISELERRFATPDGSQPSA
jgi:hypothetical protein